MVAAFRDDRRGFLAARLVRLDHEHRRAFFLGADRFEAGSGQPLFHVEHSVAGPEDDPLNLGRELVRR
ncbi:hypothetical protein OHS58_16985 [Amycolatopsis sp. NBC_00348]|uniref:hypothetical protein n=1 Tax=Amycolatopsis sp. NBC_00348 TaxID=2975956 RepID=UPI002E27486F